MVYVEQCWHKSLSPLMDAVRKEFKDIPTYVSFDIDAIDPNLCPGTGEYYAHVHHNEHLVCIVTKCSVHVVH